MIKNEYSKIWRQTQKLQTSNIQRSYSINNTSSYDHIKIYVYLRIKQLWPMSCYRIKKQAFLIYINNVEQML